MPRSLRRVNNADISVTKMTKGATLTAITTRDCEWKKANAVVTSTHENSYVSDDAGIPVSFIVWAFGLSGGMYIAL